MSLPRVPWRTWIPARGAWLALLASPTSYLCVVAALATAGAKLRVIVGIEDVSAWPLHALASAAGDVSVYGAFAALFAVAERQRRGWLVATLPIALTIAALAIGNAMYLSVSGEQLNWQIIDVGLTRFSDVESIVGETELLGTIGILASVLGVAGFIVAVLVARRSLAPVDRRATAALRAHAAVACAAVGLVIYLVAPTPSQFSLQRLRGNALLRTYWGLATGDGQWSGGNFVFRGYQPASLVDGGAVDRLRSGARPNIVLVVLESTGRSATSLAGPGAPARTPHLSALAARGFEGVRTRAVVPHTTKSVWSTLCGRLPIMQVTAFETSIELECLPRLLASAGWRTAFFQSASGDFEDRPRLVERMGFREFFASEDLGAERLGYLASDDEPLAPAVLTWADAARDAPFFATLLTSATHHDYQLSTRARERATASGAPIESDRDRHARLVEAADHMLGELVAGLQARGLLDDTIVIVVGDHGEGFGDRGVRQHDANFFEEGLRVPWVMAGPGVPVRRAESNAMLPDLVPSLLDALGVQLTSAAEAGTLARSVLRVDRPGRTLPFSCWYDGRCRGFVRDGIKAVRIPETGQQLWFDLGADPDERDVRSVDDALQRDLAEIDRIVDAHRLSAPWLRLEMTAFPAWECPEGRGCKHRGRQR